MEYLIHYNNGEEAFLAHHGVKGMHWGVRNAETEDKYRGKLGRLGSKMDLQAQKLQGAAYRERNNPGVKRYVRATRRQAEKLTRMQSKYHAYTAKKLKDKATDEDKMGLHIQKANRNVGAAAGAAAGAFGVLGGLAAYNIAKNTKHSKKAFKKQEEITRTNLRNAREEAKRGSEELHWLVKDTKNNGELDVKIRLETKQNKKQQLTPFSEIKKMQKDFENNSPSLKKHKEDLDSGKITKGYYNSMVNREWMNEITKPNTKYKFVSSYGPQGGLKRS